MSDFPPPPPRNSSGPISGSWGAPGGDAAGAGGNYVLASAGQRIWAGLLDGLLMIVTLGIGWIIWALVLFKESTSPAKKMLGLRIVDVNTGGPATMQQMPATMQQMVVREIVGKWVLGSVTGVVHLASLVMLFVTPKSQTVWDFLGTTTVVRG